MFVSQAQDKYIGLHTLVNAATRSLPPNNLMSLKKNYTYKTSEQFSVSEIYNLPNYKTRRFEIFSLLFPCCSMAYSFQQFEKSIIQLSILHIFWPIQVYKCEAALLNMEFAAAQVSHQHSICRQFTSFLFSNQNFLLNPPKTVAPFYDVHHAHTHTPFNNHVTIWKRNIHISMQHSMYTYHNTTIPHIQYAKFYIIRGK